MTSSPTPPPEPNELASALLDGELSPADAEVAARDPAVWRRLDELRAAREALRGADPGTADAPPGPVARSTAIGRALAAFDAEGEATTSDETGDPATSTTSAPHRLGRTRPVRWLSAAAAVLVLAGMVALVSRTSARDTDDTTAASTPDRAAESEEAADEADDAAGAESAGDADHGPAADEADDPAGGASATAEVGPVDLGTPPSSDALVTRAAGAVDAARLPAVETGDGAPAALPPAGGQIDPDACEATRTPGRDPLEGAVPLLEMTAVLDGHRIGVWAYPGGGGLRIVGIDERCRVVVDEVVTG